jgi:hypothetical protein
MKKSLMTLAIGFVWAFFRPGGLTTIPLDRFHPAPA